MTVLTVLITLILGTAAALTLVRVIRGPNVLNRVVGLDVLIAIMVCALGVEAAVTDHVATLPILISLSLVGFVGSVSVARFVARDADPDSTEPPAADPPPGRTAEDRP